MIIPRPQDALHKSWLYRLLMRLSHSQLLMKHLRFKGGTCAAMLGYLDRFSVDLDFDFVGSPESIPAVQQEMEALFAALGLDIKDKSTVVPQYFLKYPSKPLQRNTIKIDISTPPPRANRYETRRLHAIDRVLYCQTQETMVANKLVAPLDRYEKTGGMAGRDIYDIHAFIRQGMGFDPAIIEERTGLPAYAYLEKLERFIGETVTQKHIEQDLNVLLPYEHFQRMRKTLRQEVLFLLRDAIQRERGNGRST